MRVDVLDPSIFHRVRPFFAMTFGASLFRFDGFCSHPAANDAYADVLMGLDVFLTRHVALRGYFRVSLELTGGYVGASPFDGGVGVAARF